MSGFHERLRAARKQLGLTQEQLAFELDVTKASVSAWETGRDAPSFRLLPRLRAVLGVSLDALICGEAEPGAPSSSDGAVQTRNADEVALLKAYRKLPAKRRKHLLGMLD